MVLWIRRFLWPSTNNHNKVFLKHYSEKGWWGGLESARTNCTSRLGGVSNYLVTGHVRKHTKLIFVICNTSNSSPILICCVQKHLIWCFVKNTKKVRWEMIEFHLFKTNKWGHGVPLWWQARWQFCVQLSYSYNLTISMRLFVLPCQYLDSRNFRTMSARHCA